MWADREAGRRGACVSRRGTSRGQTTAMPPTWQSLKTGSFFYPGGNVTYQGMAVTQSRKEGILHNYKDEKEWRANIDTVMTWFTKEDLDLVTLYFGEPDSTGHKFGPDSQQRKEMVVQVDRTVGYIRDSIRRSGLEHRLNLIVTSDHGMSTVHKNASDLVEFHKFPNFTFKDIEFELLDYGPNGMLLPKEGKADEVYEALKDAHPRLHVYKKESFPKSFHYANNPRITPLLMYSDPGYVIHGVSCLWNAWLGAPSLGCWVSFHLCKKHPQFLASPQCEGHLPKGHSHHYTTGVCVQVHMCVRVCACAPRVHVYMCMCYVCECLCAVVCVGSSVSRSAIRVTQVRQSKEPGLPSAESQGCLKGKEHAEKGQGTWERKQ